MFSKTSIYYATDKTLTSSLSTEEINKQFTSTVLSATSYTTKQVSPDGSSSTVDQSRASNILTTQSAIKTSNIADIFSSEVTYPSSDDRTSLFSNEMTATTNNKQTGKYISPQLTVENNIFVFVYLDVSTQLPTSLSSSLDYSSLTDVISTKSSTLTALATDSTMVDNEQTIHSTETTYNNHDKSTVVYTTFETISSSTQPSLLLSNPITTADSPTISITSTDTLKVSNQQSTATLEYTHGILDKLSSSIFSTTAIESMPSSLVNTVGHTINSTSTTSPIIESTKNTIDMQTTSQDQSKKQHHLQFLR
jgi:hypothetical protein